MGKFAPTSVRYIKLGQKNAWAEACVRGGTLQMAHAVVPHRLCQRSAWEQVTARFLAAGYDERKAPDLMRELRDFYSLGPDCLWITFAEGFVWWAFSETPVGWLGGTGADHGCRQRKIIGAWSNKDLKGRLLRSSELSSRLTKVTGYRQTLCSIAESEDLIRRIRGDNAPSIAVARAAKEKIIQAAEKMIAGLDWKDFETMVDLIFARNGWQRVSPLGGKQKYGDLDVYQPLIDARGVVQVKSQANQRTLDKWLKYYKAGEAFDHLFFACHSPKGDLKAPGQPHIHIWVRERLADIAVQSGLYDWLLQRSA